MTAIDTTGQRAVRRGIRVYDTLVDVDVHPIMREGLECLAPYMPAAWREAFQQLPPTPAPSGLTRPFPYAGNSLTVDATPPGGGPPGSDPRFVVEDFLDRYDVGIAQLIMLEAFNAATYCPDPAMQAVLMSAYNDWMIDTWLVDPRLRHALLVSTLDADLAVAEIRRLGSDPRICSVCIAPTGGRAMGSSHYHPIYAAAVELGLPVITHSAGPAVRIPGLSYVEDRVNVAIGAWVQVNSLVLQGTFERFPELKVLIVENGFSWVVPLMWRMDAGWRRNRFELPWLKKWPSEYTRDHIRLSSQPVDDDPDASELYRQIDVEKSYLSEIICYSSDYPHWDNDRPGAVFNRLSDESKRKIFCDNAKSMLRL
jgi:predicted TIM-barrel fold metal-dependent hydrolase